LFFHAEPKPAPVETLAGANGELIYSTGHLSVYLSRATMQQSNLSLGKGDKNNARDTY
jgi:hypothetical protein